MKPGQPDLFTKRVRKGPAPKERALHIAVADTLAWGISPGWLWTHFPAGELRADKTAALLKRMGTQVGWSDFLLVGPPHGTLHALELKRRGLKPSEAQHAFMDAVVAAGGVAEWTDNYDAAIAALRAWGALSDRLLTDG